MKKRYPRTLSSGDNNAVIALSEMEVAKIFTVDTRSDIGSEAEKMKFANAVNGLVVGFIWVNSTTSSMDSVRFKAMAINSSQPLSSGSRTSSASAIGVQANSSLASLNSDGFPAMNCRRKAKKNNGTTLNPVYR